MAVAIVTVLITMVTTLLNGSINLVAVPMVTVHITMVTTQGNYNLGEGLSFITLGQGTGESVWEIVQDIQKRVRV